MLRPLTRATTNLTPPRPATLRLGALLRTMSQSSSPPEAPWKSKFISHITEHMDSPEFVLSTVHLAPKGSPVPYVPHARYCIWRGMWGELPPNKHNDAAKNPQVYASELPTFTSDVRMEKVPALFESSAGHADDESLTQGSGGGGPVEAVWWIKDVKVQWRIKGVAYVVDSNDIEGPGEESSGVRTVKSEVGKRMRTVGEGDWSWAKEVGAHFANLSPGMKGSFKAPHPGKPKSLGKKDEETVGEELKTNDDPVARKNFRVVIIRPDEVEMLDLNPETMRRDRYYFQPKSGEWTYEEVNP